MLQLTTVIWNGFLEISIFTKMCLVSCRSVGLIYSWSVFLSDKMIRESAYIELMKNCSKWNSRIESERKCRYPVLDVSFV